MKKFVKYVEVAANLAIVVVAILLAVFLVKNYLLPGSNQGAAPASQERRVLQKGDGVVLSDVDWGKNGSTLLLVLSDSCHFCTQSAPFYQRLVKEHGGATLLALFPQTADQGKAYLQKLGVEIADIRQVSLEKLNVSGTPTLILVDGGGKVAEVWRGALPPQKEEEVIQRLRAEQASR